MKRIPEHPHDLRRVARELTYPNRVSEARNVRAVDRAVFDKVREFERQTVARAETIRANARQQAGRLAETVVALETEIGEPLRNGAPPSEALAARYEALSAQFTRTKASLDKSVDDLEWVEKKLEDPYSTYMSLMDKWKIVRHTL